MRSYIATLTIILGLTQYGKARTADTIKLYFNIGIAELKPADKSKIDSFIYLDKLPRAKNWVSLATPTTWAMKMRTSGFLKGVPIM